MKVTNNKGFAHPQILIVIAMLVVVSGVGIYVAKNRDDNKNKNSVSQEASQIQPLPDDVTGLLAMDKLDKIVAKEEVGQKIVDLELKTENGVMVYNLKLSNGKVLVVNAKTGAVVTTKNDDESNDEKVDSGVILGISIEKAIEVAKSKHSGEIRKVETEVENGVVVISVRFVDGYRVDVNASDATVTREKQSGQSKCEESKDKNKNSSTKNSNEDEFEDDGQDDKPKTSSHQEDNSQENENESENEQESGHKDGSGSGHSSDSNDDN